MNALLVFLLIVIALLAAVQAGRRTRTGRRALEEHHRALDRLGHITGHQDEGPEPVGAAVGASPSIRAAESARPHVKVVATATRAGRSPRWTRRESAPPESPAAEPVGGSAVTTLEAAPAIPPRLPWPATPVGGALPPHPARPPATGDRQEAPDDRLPAEDDGEAEADGGSTDDDTVQMPAATPPPMVESPPGSRRWTPGRRRLGQPRPPAPLDELSPEPVARPLAGAPRAPSADSDAAYGVPRLDTPPGRRRRWGGWRIGLGVAAVAAVGGGVAAAVVLTSSPHHRAPPPVAARPRHRKSALSSAPAPSLPTPSTTVPARQPAVRLVSDAPGQATYRVTGSPTTSLSTASLSSWVEVRSGGPTGTVSFAGDIPAGSAQTFTGPVWIQIGNPGTVSVQLNGTAVHPPGLRAGGPFDLSVSPTG
jgi:hypothetical protein